MFYHALILPAVPAFALDNFLLHVPHLVSPGFLGGVGGFNDLDVQVSGKTVPVPSVFLTPGHAASLLLTFLGPFHFHANKHST